MHFLKVIGDDNLIQGSNLLTSERMKLFCFSALSCTISLLEVIQGLRWVYMLKGRRKNEKFPLATEARHLQAVIPENSVTKTWDGESETTA